MSGIFGVVAFDGAPSDDDARDAMVKPMAPWGRHHITAQSLDGAAFGQALTIATPEDAHTRMPTAWGEARVLFTAQGRVDNRDDLRRALGIAASQADTMADSAIMLAAYRRWGAAAAARIYGDWAFAAWHGRERRLLLARDHLGNTGLFIHREPGSGRVLFASDPRALVAAGVPRRLNEMRLAQGLVSWAGASPTETIDSDIARIPPAHTCTITPGGITMNEYWNPRKVTTLPGVSLADFSDGLRMVLDDATQARVRSASPVAVTLSGGLDSGSVTALAARALRERGAPLVAYTNVPIVDVSATVGRGRFGDEREMAAATAAFSGVEDHQLLDSASVTPMTGIERALSALDQPTHAASNAFWIQDLLSTSVANGQRTLLTGQGGNATISWTGRPLSSTFLGRLRAQGTRRAMGYLLPVSVQRHRMTAALASTDWANSAIHPAFARRLDLAHAMGQSVGTTGQTSARASAMDLRCAITQPGITRVGDLWSMNSAFNGIEVRDPTADARVVDYSFAVPDAVFRSRDGLDRMLIRTAMTGLLPEQVRLNPNRGRQSADIVARLRIAPGEVDAALAEVAGGPAEEYISMAKIRDAWAAAQRSDDPTTTHRSGTILLRGIMAALWITRTYG